MHRPKRFSLLTYLALITAAHFAHACAVERDAADAARKFAPQVAARHT